MRIFIPFVVHETGGTSSFAKKFKTGLEKKGHEVFFGFRKDYDILFVIVQCNPLYLLHAKLHKKKIVHRLDGVYYWSVAQWKYPLLNFAPRLIRAIFSDFTVYQSEYSKYCAEKFLGIRAMEKYSIIYNGVETDFFSPNGETIAGLRSNPNQKLFITVSKFRRRDQIIPIIEALETYKNKYRTDFKLLVIGDFSREVTLVPNRFKKVAYLDCIGKVNNEDLPKYERSSDVFLMTHLNPPCPNNIIEAMACGLPICGVNDGAMSEITEPEKNSLLIPAEGGAFWKRRTYDTERFADNLATIMKSRETYAKNSRRMAEERFSLTTMVDAYIHVFESLLKRNEKFFAKSRTTPS